QLISTIFMTTFLNNNLTFIGGGNMARSLIGGLIAQSFPSNQITVSDPVASQRDMLSQQYKVNVTDNNQHAVTNAQVVVLAVKPQELRRVAEDLKPALQHRPLIISVAAGIRAGDLEQWLGTPVVRTMPNRPAL